MHLIKPCIFQASLNVGRDMMNALSEASLATDITEWQLELQPMGYDVMMVRLSNYVNERDMMVSESEAIRESVLKAAKKDKEGLKYVEDDDVLESEYSIYVCFKVSDVEYVKELRDAKYGGGEESADDDQEELFG